MHMSAHVICPISSTSPIHVDIYRVYMHVHGRIHGGKRWEALRHGRALLVLLSWQDIPLVRVGLGRHGSGIEGKAKPRFVVGGVGIGLSDGREVSGAPVIGYL